MFDTQWGWAKIFFFLFLKFVLFKCTYARYKALNTCILDFILDITWNLVVFTCVMSLLVGNGDP